jgi:glycosyltransferase involved in cell wall biosynthesis
MSDVLRDETIIYFGPEPWSGLWRNRHQLMSRFARHNRVFYVEPPTNIRDCLRPGRRSKLFTHDASGVTVIHGPRWLPLTGRAPFKHLSIRAFLLAVSLVSGTAFGRRPFGRKPIIWYAKPGMVDYVGKSNARQTIYHVVDEYSGYGHPSKTDTSAPDPDELRMLRSVDTVIVVTTSLFESKSQHNPNTHVVANAVNFEAYSDDALSTPDDMINIKGTVIGYSGLVAARLDITMLQAAASARPEWNFVFVGTINDAWCETELERLRELPNVHMLGTKDVDEVPRYVHQFDVCIIPYVLNLRAQHASPLKLYEYAAASKPIVSTSFAAASNFEGQVRFADDADQLLAECEKAIKLDAGSVEVVENRRVASENTWEHRVRQLSKILSDDS